MYISNRPGAGEMNVPDNYGGTSLYDTPAEQTGSSAQEASGIPASRQKEVKYSPSNPIGAAEPPPRTDEPQGAATDARPARLGDSLSRARDFLSSLPASAAAAGLRLPELHTEEYLLLAIAVILLLAPDGDRLCALLLLGLLFV